MGITHDGGYVHHVCVRDAHHTITVTRIGGHAYRYLAAKPRTGQVASLFRHGLNVAFDDGGSAAWVSVQSAAVPLHPWAVRVSAVPSNLEAGDLVTSDGECVRFGASSLSLREARVDDLRIAPYTPGEAELALSRLPLLEQFLERARPGRPSDPFQPEIDAILERWQATGDSSLLIGLVGLGIGSTPSGDDLLVGLAAGLTALCTASDKAGRRLQGVLSGLRGEGGSALARTAPASRQALAAALEASFPESLCRLIGDLGAYVADADRIRTSTRHILALGATSGASMLGGLCAAGHSLT
jgi:hypothetical protein